MFILINDEDFHDSDIEPKHVIYLKLFLVPEGLKK